MAARVLVCTTTTDEFRGLRPFFRTELQRLPPQQAKLAPTLPVQFDERDGLSRQAETHRDTVRSERDAGWRPERLQPARGFETSQLGRRRRLRRSDLLPDRVGIAVIRINAVVRQACSFGRQT